MKNASRCIVLWTFVFLLVLAKAPALAGQQITGAINGTVSDSSGARVAGATVTAVSTATNLTVTGQSSREGAYQIPKLPIGTYVVTITLPGFKTETHTSIQVEGNR